MKKLLLLLVPSLLFGQFSQERQRMPLIIQDLSDAIGRNINNFSGWKWEGQWIEVPVQVDERQLVTFGKNIQAQEYRYLPGDGIFDQNDEIVFMLKDCGDQAPAGSYPAGNERIEIAVTDPLDGTTQYFYIAFSPASIQDDYVSYSRVETGQYTEDTWINGIDYKIHYSKNWVLDEIHYKVGGDFIDRVKFRVYGLVPVNGFNETEDYWSDGRSTYIGAKDGNVRVIRMIEGAASGYRTTYHAKFYGDLVKIEYNYRVHKIPELWSYVDYKSSVSVTPYNIQDEGTQVLRAWNQGSTNRGSLVTWFDQSALVPFTQRAEKYYRNDNFDDLTGEDGISYHNMGSHLWRVENLDGVAAKTVHQYFVVLPANAPESGQYAQIFENPVTWQAVYQSGGGQGDTQPPSVSVSYPAGGETFALGDTVLVQWQSSDDTGIESHAVKLDRNGLIEPLADLDGAANQLEWIVTGPVSPANAFIVQAIDSAGNIGSAESGSFAISDTNSVPGNQPPSAVINAQPTQGQAPLAVNFDGSQSTDDGQITFYDWNFGDGNTASGVTVQHTYQQPGTYKASLEVIDDLGLRDTAYVDITVTAQNQAPVATITAPTEGSSYQTGEMIYFAGTGIDQEDGDLPASAFTWTVLAPDNQIHPVATGVKSGYDSVPYPGQYTLILEVQDSGGLTDTDSVTFTATGASLLKIRGSGDYVSIQAQDTINGDLIIYDLLGREVYRKFISSNRHEFVPGFATGVYFMVLKKADRVVLRRKLYILK